MSPLLYAGPYQTTILADLYARANATGVMLYCKLGGEPVDRWHKRTVPVTWLTVEQGPEP